MAQKHHLYFVCSVSEEDGPNKIVNDKHEHRNTTNEKGTPPINLEVCLLQIVNRFPCDMKYLFGITVTGTEKHGSVWDLWDFAFQKQTIDNAQRGKC